MVCHETDCIVLSDFYVGILRLVVFHGLFDVFDVEVGKNAVVPFERVCVERLEILPDLFSVIEFLHQSA